MSLRLADVIGPWDDSCRFWKYIIWAKAAKLTEKLKIQINASDHQNQKLSFTYSPDVGSAIIKEVTSALKTEGTINLACSDSMTLFQFLLKIEAD